ncbi:MAG: excinuclease ABC subunit UvrA [Christensenellaceae bacterium]|jgi:excinuclease ABC subunit A|nr:excinuclease ABC subunit UvrA [Christensenellaceae bacterium]
MEEKIVIRGARENNLKNIDLEIPRGKMVVFTGVSGSGKSTLAFDTIFAEGQRRYMESLSSYARQFLGQAQKPDVESIEGLSPAIAIDQKTTSNNPRSTVGTVTEIYDYLRLLYARIGVPYCPRCNKVIAKQSVDSIVDKVASHAAGSKIIIMSPVVRGEKGTFAKLFDELRKGGYARVSVDGDTRTLDEEIVLDKNKKHNISVVIDRLVLKEDLSKRLTESIETALKLSDGLVVVEVNSEKHLFSNKFACDTCGFAYEEISPRLFSFNSPFGACPHCSGLGFVTELDVDMVIGDKNKSLNEGALKVSGWNMDIGGISSMYFRALAKEYKFSLDTPIKDLPKNIMQILLYGNDGKQLSLHYDSKNFQGSYVGSFEGVINNLMRRYKESSSEMIKLTIGKYMKEHACEVCHGQRLSDAALSVRVGRLNIAELTALSIVHIKEYLSKLQLNATQMEIASPILKEINARLDFLTAVGLHYLTLNRMAGSLSGGEAQRIRLATQIGSGLVGVLYILDEPSIGLHQRDNAKLLDALQRLRDLGNTLIVVEHDEDTMRAADYIVDIGPRSGIHGGEVVAAGSIDDIKNSPNSITGKYLSGQRRIDVPAERRKPQKGWLSVTDARQNNLIINRVNLPLGVLTAITGVSGSGKSSLINEIVYPALFNRLNGGSEIEGKYKELLGFESLDKVINIDQSPIGKTPRSNPATYVGLFTLIRELFAATPEAKERGYNSGRFSFNVKGGRCEECDGDGTKKIEMYFLPDVYIPCSVCRGKRYNRETLQVKYKGKSISDVLDMTVEEALQFFANIPQIKNKIQTLFDVGLGYIKLGQSSTTLSGGEAQRVKLASELSRRSTGRTIYILDEPTTGLHSYDVDKLIMILQKLVELGNTVVVIEHNMDVIKVADYIIDLGPEGGDNGGKIVCKGTPEEVAQNKESFTGMFLKTYLK